MNILFLTENFPPETNAAATRVYERACYWVRWGHKVTVITCAPNFPEGRLFSGYANRWRQVETMSGIRVVRVKTFIAPNRGVFLRTLDFMSFFASGTIGSLLEAKPDVVVATSPQFFTAVAGYTVGLTRKVPFVFELGDLWPASIAAVGAVRQSLILQLLEKLELHLYRRAETVVALTHHFKENLVARGIEAGKIAVVMNGVDAWRYGHRPRDAALAKAWGLEERFVVGYVGTHGMAHGLRNVLDAAEGLLDEPNLRFLFVGAGAERASLIQDAARRGLSNVVFMPRQPKEAMPAVWSLCDVALVHLRDAPVFRGVVPSKMFEAMAVGLPIVLAGPAGEASRILEEDQAGLWVPPEDAAALARCIRELMTNRELCRRIAAQSLAAAPRHTREAQARQMIQTLETAARGRGAEAAQVAIMAAARHSPPANPPQ